MNSLPHKTTVLLERNEQRYKEIYKSNVPFATEN